MLGALATSHKVGIAVVAGVFIAFALASSFLFPSWRPTFPGKRVGLFVWVTVLLTAGMLATVIALAAEPKEERARPGEETTAAAATTEATTTTTASPSAAKGDVAAGKSLFSAQGCSACHTFKPAGSTAKVGPDLDNVAADAEKANEGSVEEYVAESIKDPNAYVVPGYPKGVMPAFASLGEKQIDDLVAFVTSA